MTTDPKPEVKLFSLPPTTGLCNACGFNGKDLCATMEQFESELKQIRGDRDHFDMQHRTMLQEKNALQSQLREREAETAKLREALGGCVHFLTSWMPVNPLNDWLSERDRVVANAQALHRTKEDVK